MIPAASMLISIRCTYDLDMDQLVERRKTSLGQVNEGVTPKDLAGVSKLAHSLFVLFCFFCMHEPA